jgi:hypothetical protein
MNAIVKEEAPPLQASSSLEKIVRHCLAKQPSGRYQTTAEVKAALEKLFAAKATVAAVEPQPSIAVLPFVNMSGDYERAIAVDPKYALAWYGLAFFYYLMGFLGFISPKLANAQSRRAALEALELDDMLAEAHAIMAALRANDFEWKEAGLEFRRAKSFIST